MKSRPILFSAHMVNAIRVGAKFQTRRSIKPQPVSPAVGAYFDCYDNGPQWNWWSQNHKQHLEQIIKCPYGVIGDQLWVKENYHFLAEYDHLKPSEVPVDSPVWWPSSHQDSLAIKNSDEIGRLRPSIFLPKWASRITLEITNIRAERLHDITEQDAIDEGILPDGDLWTGYTKESALWQSPCNSFMSLWASINGKKSWESNPWVWVVEFRVVR